MSGCDNLPRVWPDRKCPDCGHPASIHRNLSKVCVVCTEPEPRYAMRQ